MSDLGSILLIFFYRKDYVMKEVATSKKRDRDYRFLVQEYRTVSKLICSDCIVA